MEKPAIEGGKTLRKNFLVFGKPEILEEDINEVVDSLRKGWISSGEKVEKFEEMFREYNCCKNAIAVNSCTAGLFLSLSLLGVNKGDEVITTPMTFAPTANVIEHLKAKPVFVDVEKETGLIDAEKIEEKISEKTKCILPVHLYGRPCEMDRIMEISKEKKLAVLEDCAHAIETEYKGKKVGCIGDFGAFSFYATKNVTTGEGGMITTNNNELAEKTKLLRMHGLDSSCWKKFSSEEFKPTDVLYAGYKFNLTDLHASLGIHQLGRIEKNLKERKKQAKIYLEEFEKIDELILMNYSEKNIRHAFHLFAVLLDLEKLNVDRNKFVQAMKKENIGTGVHFTSLHLTQYYKEKYGFKKEDYPNSAFISDRTFSLPIGPGLSEEDIIDCVNAVKKIIGFYRK